MKLYYVLQIPHQSPVALYSADLRDLHNLANRISRHYIPYRKAKILEHLGRDFHGFFVENSKLAMKRRILNYQGHKEGEVYSMLDQLKNL
jgi:hypothetical protein